MGSTQPNDWILDDDPSSATKRIERVLAHIHGAIAEPCAGCAKVLCGHEALFSLIAGHENSPLCSACLSQDIGKPRADMRDQLAAFAMSKECLTQGWKFANLKEGFAVESLPTCLWAADESTATIAPVQATQVEETATSDFVENETWNAGDKGCGELVLELRLRMQKMQAKEVLLLIADDPGAPEDIPAWCRLIGHQLLKADHPTYWIERKEES